MENNAMERPRTLKSVLESLSIMAAGVAIIGGCTYGCNKIVENERERERIHNYKMENDLEYRREFIERSERNKNISNYIHNHLIPAAS